MIRLLADENFDRPLLLALIRERPGFDIVRAQDIGLAGLADPILLDRAAAEGRLLITRDARTIPRFAYDRSRQGEPMPGVLVIRRGASFRRVVEDILLLNDAGEPADYSGRVIYLPL